MSEHQSITLDYHRRYCDVTVFTQRRRGEVGERVKVRVALPRCKRVKK